MNNKIWNDKCAVRILFMIAKIFARRGEKTYVFEIEKIEKEIFESEEK